MGVAGIDITGASVPIQFVSVLQKNTTGTFFGEAAQDLLGTNVSQVNTSVGVVALSAGDYVELFSILIATSGTYTQKSFSGTTSLTMFYIGE